MVLIVVGKPSIEIYEVDETLTPSRGRDRGCYPRSHSLVGEEGGLVQEACVLRFDLLRKRGPKVICVQRLDIAVMRVEVGGDLRNWLWKSRVNHQSTKVSRHNSPDAVVARGLIGGMGA